MKSPAFQRERERRRWSPDKPGRRPIDPPYAPFLGRPPEPAKIKQRYVWFTEKLAGHSVTTLAEEAGISKAAITQGIEDFKRRLPGDFKLAFPTATKSAIRQWEMLFPLDNVRVPTREPLIRWLAQLGMRPEDIARLVGYSVGEVGGILKGLQRKSA